MSAGAVKEGWYEYQQRRKQHDGLGDSKQFNSRNGVYMSSVPTLGSGIPKDPIKQFAIMLPHKDWLLIRDEAIRRHVPLTELGRECLEPMLKKLRNQKEKRDAKS